MTERFMIFMTASLKSSVRLLATLLVCTGFVIPAKASVQAELSVVGDAINVQFSGRADWPYEVTRSGNKVSVSVPKLDLKSRSRLLQWNGPLISKIEVQAGPDEKDVLVFTLASSQVQTFDYLTDQPSRLLVDFFVAEERKAKVQEEPEQAPVAKPSVAEKKTAQILKPSRKPASKELLRVDPANLTGAEAPLDPSSKGVFDGADPEFARFDINDYEIDPKALLASQENIYLRFPMLQTEDDSLELLLKNRPLYEISPKDGDENKKARLLLTLFNNKRYAIFLRTIDFFRQAYPKSEYDEILRYLEADVYYDLWLRDKSLADFQTAMTKYNALLLDYPQSPLAERTQLLVSYSFKERGDVLNALAQLERYKRQYPKSGQRFQVNLAIADCFKKLNKTEDAERILREIESDPTSGEFGLAASYRRGDIYIETRDYEKALATYAETLKKNPESAKKFPSASFNTAEALFWQGNYKDSLNKYKEFLVRFPTSTHGGFAMTRIGEILEVLGASPSKVSGAYLESIFRYRGTPGAGIANIRLTKERMKDMKPKEVLAALKEVSDFVATSDLPRIRDFEVVNVGDGYLAGRNFEKALELFQGFYRANPTSTNLDLFRNRIVKTLAAQLRDHVDKGDHIAALRHFAQHSPNWFKSADRIDVDFAVGQSYEGLGAPTEALEFFKKAFDRRLQLVGKSDEAKRIHFEKVPSLDSIRLRMAAVQARNGNLVAASESLRELRKATGLTEQETVEQVQLESRVARAKNDLPLAEKYMLTLSETWKGQPEKLVPLFMELAQVQLDMKKSKEALASIDRVVELAGAEGSSISQEVHAKALQIKGDTLLAMGRKDRAVEVYQDLLEKFESQKALGSIRYQVGKIQFEEGRISDAEKTWDVLGSNPENQVWARMAKEQLTHSKWQEDYKKYIERIPAMSGFKESQP